MSDVVEQARKRARSPRSTNREALLLNKLADETERLAAERETLIEILRDYKQGICACRWREEHIDDEHGGFSVRTDELLHKCSHCQFSEQVIDALAEMEASQ